MSSRLETLQVARLAPKLLGESASFVETFLRRQFLDDGGVRDRSGKSDLYYTVFGMEGLLALQAEIPSESIGSYLKSFGSGEHLDLVHLGCLARAAAHLPEAIRPARLREELPARFEQFRSRDGAYSPERGAESGTIYGSFLALGFYSDMGMTLPDPESLVRCVTQLRAEDGGYANQVDIPQGLTPVTAAAVTILRATSSPIPETLGDWLFARQHDSGGFFATPLAPLPDLLSTATALHTLDSLHKDLGPIRERCLDFIDTLWTNRGGFHGNWTDDELDCEYTYYGLLALGHLVE